jgi:hypothetical protein
MEIAVCFTFCAVANIAKNVRRYQRRCKNLGALSRGGKKVLPLSPTAIKKFFFKTEQKPL